jgi:hypothetical protein
VQLPLDHGAQRPGVAVEDRVVGLEINELERHGGSTQGSGSG